MKLFGLALAWSAGILLGHVDAVLVSWQWLLLATVSMAAARGFRAHPAYRWSFAVLAVALLGAGRLAAARPDVGRGHVARYNEYAYPVRLSGVVVAPPDPRDQYTGLRLQVDWLEDFAAGGRQQVHGRVLVRAPASGRWAYGDRLELRGTLETPPVFDTFSYRDYLARQGVHSLITPAELTRRAANQANPALYWVYRYRTRALGVIQRLYPDPEASLLAGILLGIESQIHPKVREAFNRTGTSHIIAISGFNISIVAALFVDLLGRWLGARRGAFAAATAIGAYTLFVGADAAVVRAAIMGGLGLLARRIGRTTDAMASLGATALLMTLIDPYTLFDVGFQLSFAATLGLVLYAAPLQAWFQARSEPWLGADQASRVAAPVGEYVLFTLAAQFTTLPLTVFYFRRLSLVSLVANPTILPLQPPVMILGGISALLGSLWAPLGQALAWVTWPLMALTIRLVEFFAGLGWGSIGLGSASIFVLGGGTLMILAWTALGGQELPLPWLRFPSVPRTMVLAVLALAAALTWRAVADRPDGWLHLTILEAGLGDAVLIETPEGRFVLVDGGPSGVALSEALGRRLPLFARGIDWVILSGTGREQIEALAGGLDRFPAGGLIVAAPPGGRAYRQVVELFRQAERPVVEAAEGTWLDLGRGARLTFAARGDRGAILLVEHGRARVVLAPAADSGLTGESRISRRLEGVTAALLPDGGSASANPATWLAALSPRLTILSLEAGNRRELPAMETVEALTGSRLLRTDLNGWVRLSTDGERLWVNIERLPERMDDG